MGLVAYASSDEDSDSETSRVPAKDATKEDPDQDPDQDPRSLIHSLTLPSTFLALKRKGTHFNNKLLASASLRNPSLMDKLLAYVDVGDADQYQTTLPADLWDANAFPEWAYRDRLRRTREKMAKKKEADKAGGNRTTVDFVPAVNASGADGAGGAGGLSRSEDRANNWR
ncbi:Meiotically up-regulated protein [Escovopsis weberi]|uniref:Meiotically up-regulated protein n=1 Tax=Escovopsis weberi TaxID=150374 RepID=A0A0M8MPS7_ESCWE|nr:Meiotically up-regulated protein [Escovopsis weberi]